MNAPPRLFERRRTERPEPKVIATPPPEGVIRPLVLLVVRDPEIEVIVQRVCNNLGYGFVSARDGAAGLELARAYRPNLVLADAFLPKLDGREMCRILREEAAAEGGGGGLLRTVVMTGLYTDAKYRDEARARFHIDDYLFKPVSITDLINLLQKDLEGVKGLPAQEDLHTLHRKDVLAPAAPAVDRDTVTRLERELIGAMRIANAAPDAALKARRPLVLLVEDDENLQLIVRTVAAQLGYGFMAVANGQDGLAAAREHRPDLVIADAFRPALDGRKLVRQLKGDPLTAGVKAILMTGARGDDDSLAKPLAVEDLVRLLKKHLPSDVRPRG
jgi:CheY-like chemotaxis protein